MAWAAITCNCPALCCYTSSFIHSNESFLSSRPMHHMAVIYYCHIFSFSLNSYLICNIALLVGGCIALVFACKSRTKGCSCHIVYVWSLWRLWQPMPVYGWQMVRVIRSHYPAVKSAPTDKWMVVRFWNIAKILELTSQKSLSASSSVVYSLTPLFLPISTLYSQPIVELTPQRLP